MTAPPTVLIVDDESLARWSVAETLRDSGYQVLTAADAHAAMRVMSGPGTPPDVVLLDLRLPDSDDFGVLSAMQRIAPATKIILITAHGSAELFDEAQKRGAFASLDKPVEMSDLPSLVARALAARNGAGSLY
jgi:DNA-binding NtrC family response regulator